ncbi:hypothetical protein IU534_003162 [Salmonella enterica]|nr:hypothetical protein [Salmonella enterica subsp. enterica serovar Muenchen]ECI2458977.1 hypothetical protein [Salmonella enterica subsp. enterica]EDX1669904.1 hypothetical protein [Salmonella enterica subsp. enterica serovar Ouakam]EGN7128234.1 hypothetical protein [Salmonella enterica]ECG4055131.1 hypothetical protein [Salmonella enterica subsp. enterica serovar Muenchen]
MSEQQNGGPAFPEPVMDFAQYRGMTLRDYFAGKVLQGVMASGTSMSIGTNHEEAMLDMARAFYSMADAMIKARELP